LTPRKIGVDSSVIAKWFKSGEEKEDLALKLRSQVFSGETVILSSELMPLEVCRALVKVGYPRHKIAEACSTLEEMDRLGFIELAPVSTIRHSVTELLAALSLHVGDAIGLATAISGSMDLLTEDRHLRKESVVTFAKKAGVRILCLDEMYGKAS
jgi:predicted nucleic acid-binding protein